MRGLPLLFISGVLAGCASSPPTHFYTLDAVSPQRAHSPAVTVNPVKVDAVHIPPLLDRRAMVRREAGTELQISSQDHWGASFGDMAREVLTENLQSRMPPGAVIAPNAPAPEDARGLVVDILSFVPNGSGEVGLMADWTLLEGAPPRPVLMRTAHLTQAAGNSAANQADAMSALLGKLADQIATEALTASSQGAR
jgi:uncharacterized protein